MKVTSKYCAAMLFILLIFNKPISAAEPEQPIAADTIQGKIIQGQIIWGDLYTGNVQASLDFYTATFGWTTKTFGQDNTRYHLLYDGDQAIAGVLKRPTQRNKTESALWIGSFATNNVQLAVNNASNKQATIMLAPHNFALYGERAVIADPQGAIVALLDLDEKKQSHQNISAKWDWAQLFSVNTQKAADFYRDAFSYSIEQVENNKGSFYLLKQEILRASIVSIPASFEQRDRWVNFVVVDNLAKTLVAADKNGAEIIYQPQGAQVAIIADPQGALLGLTEQESE
ncbi:VOC family protein [Colwellia asteriadis]|uniref:VOC family protein n=1 Tax=Colwellia asteriadis TaxID=517723 RepID=A0ABP3WEB5_9GAMM